MGKRWTSFKSIFGPSSTKVSGMGDGEKGAGNIVLFISPDGFIPQVQFIGDTLEQLLTGAVWSYAAITGNAGACGSLPGIVQTEGQEDTEADWIRDKTHPLTKFVKQPLPPDAGLPDWSWQQVIETACMQLDLCGNSYWRIIKLSSGTVFLQPLHPQDVEPFLVDGLINHYRVTFRSREAQGGGSSGKVLVLLPDEIVHIANASPGTLFTGSSPTTAAIRSLEIDRVASERQKANLENKISPGLIISIKGLFGLSKEQRATVKKDLEDNYRKATDDGRPLVIGEGNSIEAAPMTTQQLDYFDTRRFSREEILAVYGVPPPIVGVYDQATLQNFAQARVIWWTTALFPRLNRVLSAFNRQLIDPMFNTGRNADVRLWYDVTGSDIGLQQLDQKLDIGIKYQQLGYPTNAINNRLELGMPAFDELDLPNSQLVQAGRTGEASLAIDAESKDLGEIPDRIGDDEFPKMPMLSIMR